MGRFRSAETTVGPSLSGIREHGMEAHNMRQQLARHARLPHALLAALALVGAGSLTAIVGGADAAAARPAGSGTVLQTNLVSDLAGAAAVTDPNLVNAWGISEGPTTPFWISDNNSGFTTLYQVPGSTPPVTPVPLVVSIPTPVSPIGGTPTGTVFNPGSAANAFPITGPNKAGMTTTAGAVFLFDTEDGTIIGWNPGIDPTGKFAGPNGFSTEAVIAKDKSGNNFTNPNPDLQRGAVYKGLAMATNPSAIFPRDPASTALLYATNFRAGTVEVYDSAFQKPTGLSPRAFTDRRLPAGYAPFNVQVFGSKVYVTYARQDAARHDDLAGPHRGFVDVFNLDGSPGLPGHSVRLISRGVLDSPWGLAMAPTGFAGFNRSGHHPVLLVGNFGDGRINAFSASSGFPVGQLRDPDGEPIQVDGLWALQVGNGSVGGASDTVYFTAGPFGESHGLFGALTTAAAGSAEGPAEAQWVQANLDVVQLDLQQLNKDTASGASAATIQQDTQTLDADSHAFLRVEHAFAADNAEDASS
jgi:uncharacterized protein (TIGR03118 family)